MDPTSGTVGSRKVLINHIGDESPLCRNEFLIPREPRAVPGLVPSLRAGVRDRPAAAL
jgi:hypothetical protein